MKVGVAARRRLPYQWVGMIPVRAFRRWVCFLWLWLCALAPWPAVRAADEPAWEAAALSYWNAGLPGWALDRYDD